MKVVLAGAYGHLGRDILKELVKQGHEVVASDMVDAEVEGLDKSKYTFAKLNVTDKESLKGLCDGADVVITTVGLTKTKNITVTNYDIDYQGNLNLLEEAKSAGVKHFVYISVIKADLGKGVPMVESKYMFEEELKKSGLSYVIHRPTGYFYDIVAQFRPMIEKGEGMLLGKKPVSANVVDTPDFAEFIVNSMLEENKTYNVGGTETYTFDEILTMCFEASNKPVVIKRAPVFLFNILIALPKNKKNGASASLKFLKFVQTQDLVGDTKVGKASFKEYIKESFSK